DNSFKYGKVDGAHSYHEGDDGEFWSNVDASLKEAGGPISVEQKGLAWAFLPAFFAGVAFGLPPQCSLLTSCAQPSLRPPTFLSPASVFVGLPSLSLHPTVPQSSCVGLARLFRVAKSLQILASAHSQPKLA
ncbi:unnamed protein product, partial [Closterium sp. Naga37s-1]